MPAEIIDSKTDQGPTGAERRPPFFESRADKTETASGPKKEEAIAWSAYDYEKKDRGQRWMLFPTVAAFLLAFFAVFTRSYFFLVFIVLAYIVFMMYERRGPREISFSVNKEGVRAGTKLYKFSDLKSFWIFEAAGRKELSLETRSTVLSFVHLPLGTADHERIRATLRSYLPEEEHHASFIDEVTRELGF